MKVLVLPSHFPTDEFPTRYIFVKEQVESICDSEISQDVFYLENRSILSKTRKKNKFEHIHFFKNNNVNIIFKRNTNIIPSRFFIGAIIWSFISFLHLRKYVKNHGLPDIIHVHSLENAGILALILNKIYKIPYIITEHSPFRGNKKLSKTKKLIYRKILKDSSSILPVSKYLKNYIMNSLDYRNENFEIIPNLVDTDFFESNETISNFQEIRFVAICNLNDDKRVDRLINAFNLSLKKNPNLHLDIGGAGVRMEELKSLVSQLNINKQVTFHGLVQKNKIKELLTQSHCLLLSSDSETFGIVLIESMSMGIPVISTKSGGPIEIVNSSNGILSDRTVEDFSMSINQFIDNINKYDSSLIRNFVLNNYSKAVVSKKIINVYKQAMSLKK